MAITNDKNAAAKNDFPKYEIFLVEDDKFLVNIYSVKFQHFGYKVAVAENGSEALTKIMEGYKPDIMLCDISMPVMNGHELLEAVRKSNLLKDTVIIILTNQSDSNDMTKALSLGVHGFIVKATKLPSEVVAEVFDIARKQGKKIPPLNNIA